MTYQRICHKTLTQDAGYKTTVGTPCIGSACAAWVPDENHPRLGTCGLVRPGRFAWEDPVSTAGPSARPELTPTRR